MSRPLMHYSLRSLPPGFEILADSSPAGLTFACLLDMLGHLVSFDFFLFDKQGDLHLRYTITGTKAKFRKATPLTTR